MPRLCMCTRDSVEMRDGFRVSSKVRGLGKGRGVTNEEEVENARDSEAQSDETAHAKLGFQPCAVIRVVLPYNQLETEDDPV